MRGTLVPVVALLVGAGVGFGVLLVLAGVRGVAVLPAFGDAAGVLHGSDAAAVGRVKESRQAIGQGTSATKPIRWILAGVVGLVVLVITRWPGVALVAAVAVVVLPRVTGGRAERRDWIAKTQAIASWTEMLRDTMAAADGVEEAIAATVPIAPGPIRAEVAMLDARRRSEQPLADALAEFGAELDHPSADLVVAALAAAAQGEGADFVAVLSRLSAMIRDEVKMRLRVEASRAKMRTAGLIIMCTMAVAGAGLLLVGRQYMEPYNTLAGQVVLMFVGVMVALALLLLNRMSRIVVPERFTPRRRELRRQLAAAPVAANGSSAALSGPGRPGG